MPVCNLSHGDKIPFFDLVSPYISNRARNANPGLIRAYRFFGKFMITALIGVFLKACFRITDYPVPNQKQEILLGEKPALLFPIGWLIFSHVTWSSRRIENPLF
jgi:hypothetical protein